MASPASPIAATPAAIAPAVKNEHEHIFIFKPPELWHSLRWRKAVPCSIIPAASGNDTPPGLFQRLGRQKTAVFKRGKFQRAPLEPEGAAPRYAQQLAAVLDGFAAYIVVV